MPTKQFRAIVLDSCKGLLPLATVRGRGLYRGLRPQSARRFGGGRSKVEITVALIEYRVGPTIAQVQSVDIDWSDTSPAPIPSVMR
jgi:hypothetical protein